MPRFCSYLLSLLLFVLGSLSLWGQEGSPKEGKRYAFVLGINDYKDIRLTNLKNAKNDAEGILRTLYRSGNFTKIKSMVQSPLSESEGRLTKYEILSEYESLLEELGPDDFLFFFYSGHGFIDYDEKAYLMPEDANTKNVIDSGISIENLILLSQKKKIKKVVFILDACRNPEQGSGEQGRQYLEKETFSGSDLVSVFYSTKIGYYSYEDTNSAFGVFTKFLLYGLEGRADSNFNGKVTYKELTEYVIQSLKEWSKTNQKLQKPYVKYYGETSEDLTLTFAYNPETSMADAPLFNPYNPTFAFRSLVFPGWGQYERGQTTKGIAWMSAFGLALLHTGYRFQQNEEAIASYSNAVGIPPNPRITETALLNYLALTPARERAEETNRAYDFSLSLLLGIWIGNVFDFYLLGPEKPKETGYRIFWDAKIQNHGILGKETQSILGYEFRF